MMPRLRPFDTISRIAVGLAALVVLCLVTIDALFGLVADPALPRGGPASGGQPGPGRSLMVAATRLERARGAADARCLPAPRDAGAGHRAATDRCRAGGRQWHPAARGRCRPHASGGASAAAGP